MTDLFRYSQQLHTIFDLLGDNENDITASIGWASAQSETFLTCLLKEVFPGQYLGQKTEIRLQDAAGSIDYGYTDIEIESDRIHVIIEAKRGWHLPDRNQLEKYAVRFKSKKVKNAVVVMAECVPTYAAMHLQRMVGQIPVHYLSWKQIAQIADQCAGQATRKEKYLLHDLHTYLRGIMSMQNQNSNLVYVVSLGTDTPEWSTVSWIEFITKKKRYFHPYDKNWPKEPPNYLGFRYYGQLQSIHHVEGYEIVSDLHTRIKEIRSGMNWGDMALYTLGPPITPQHIVKTGNVYGPGHDWVALDLLLTCQTVSEARTLTKKRAGAVK
ncbi:hypothetical protein TFLX_05811 [Thermoflexales bacterium]|nr:hypothetical protein TFLX_05811 [Thermoflexales bacterium]